MNISKFDRSQNAHKRLTNKFYKSKDVYDVVKMDYHNSVYHKQKKEKRILSYKEKRAIYRNCEDCFYDL